MANGNQESLMKRTKKELVDIILRKDGETSMLNRRIDNFQKELKRVREEAIDDKNKAKNLLVQIDNYKAERTSHNNIVTNLTSEIKRLSAVVTAQEQDIESYHSEIDDNVVTINILKNKLHNSRLFASAMCGLAIILAFITLLF